MVGLARRFFAESLFRNAAYLFVNLGIGAIAGYVSLALLTRSFSKADVGLSAVAVSAIMLISGITQLGITYSAPRYLPTAKNRTAMINTLLTAIMSATFIGCLVFFALPYSWQFFALGGWLFVPAFIITALVQVGTIVLGMVLIADRASGKLTTWGLIPAATRVAAPPALAFLNGFGCFLARLGADLVSFVLYGALLHRGGHRFRPTLDRDVVREIGRFSLGMYIANIVGGLPLQLLPLVGLARIGAEQSAYWSIAMSVASILYSLPSMVTSALLPEVSLRPGERGALLRRAAMMIIAVVTPALAVAFFAAPLALAVFGHSYTAGTLSVLRWMIAGCFITMLNAVSGAILFTAKKSTLITVVNAIDAVIVIGLAAFWATNATQIAISWVIGDVANTVFFSFFAFVAVREVGGRMDLLGEDAARAAAAGAAAATEPGAVQVPSSLRAASAELLASVAEEQRASGMYGQYQPAFTGSQGLFNVAALRAAEVQRLADSMTRPEWRQKDPVLGTQEALGVLFSIAERQRAETLTRAVRRPRFGAPPPSLPDLPARSAPPPQGGSADPAGTPGVPAGNDR